METKNILIIIGLIVGAGALLLGALFHGSTLPDDLVVTPATKKEKGALRIITAKHQFAVPIHTIAGELDLPTPCHLLETETTVQGKVATVIFKTTSQADFCAQVITSARFKTEFEAPEDIEIAAVYNGEKVILNLIDSGPDENLDEFDLFIKG